MNYKDTIEYLYHCAPVFEKIGAGAYKEGLDNTHALDERLGHPHRQFLTIHVAGTNGKGSVSHTLAAILQAAGYKVGLYTSPHLMDFRERIRVNGICVDKRYVINFVKRHRTFFEPLHPSFFELTTAMAFDYFARQQVDIAVVEVGLGGRLDCTNIITPLVSVITNISKDHTQFLGDTIAQIAGEKAGIIKRGVPVVIGEANETTRPVFTAKAREMEAPITFAEDHPLVTAAQPTPDGGMDYTHADGHTFHGQLGGIYQVKNTCTVLTAVDVARHQGLQIPDEAVEAGFAMAASATGLMGRWQILRQQPTVVCDTGHNAGGWQYISRQLSMQHYAHLHIVFGMVDDKDIDTVLGMLPTDATYYFTQSSSRRAIPHQEVLRRAASHHLPGTSYPTVAEAYKAALAAAKPEDFVFVGGSSYVVADLLVLL